MSSPSDDLRYWLALIHLQRIGPATLNPLLREGFTPRQILEHPPRPVADKLRKAIDGLPWEKVEQDLQWLDQPGNFLLPATSNRYPENLRRLPDAPIALFVHGQPEVLSNPQIALVGSRKPTRGGLQNAHDFAAYLAGSGITIVSGLALGIDTASHQGALDANGITIAVTATGLDRVYPAANLKLAHAIAEQGALISEFPPGTSPSRGHFPRRNRIISGLSLGVLVIEASINSGSLITARKALEQSREVFAIPGSIHNPLSRGCHLLIKQGAKLVETASDILEELSPALHNYLLREVEPESAPPPTQDNSSDCDYSALLQAMGHDPVSADILTERTGLPPETVSSMLLLLEMEGRVSSEAGGLFMRL